MDDAALVRRLQRFGDLAGDPKRFALGERPTREAFGERLPFDQLEDQRRLDSVSSSP